MPSEGPHGHYYCHIFWRTWRKIFLLYIMLYQSLIFIFPTSLFQLFRKVNQKVTGHWTFKSLCRCDDPALRKIPSTIIFRRIRLHTSTRNSGTVTWIPSVIYTHTDGICSNWRPNTWKRNTVYKSHTQTMKIIPSQGFIMSPISSNLKKFLIWHCFTNLNMPLLMNKTLDSMSANFHTIMEHWGIIHY